MKKKNFWGLLVVLFVAVFAFAACSDDDDDDKTGTYEYQVINSFDGDIESINKVSDAFKQAFGADSAPFKLTGTKAECNRKAKEYAMKAQAALAGDGSFSAEVKLINVTTEELIHSFDIQKDENAKLATPFHYTLDKDGINVYDIKGSHIKIEKLDSNVNKYTVFDDVIETDKQLINLYRIAASKGFNYMGYYEFTLYKGTSNNRIRIFSFYFNRQYAAGDGSY